MPTHKYMACLFPLLNYIPFDTRIIVGIFRPPEVEIYLKRPRN